MKIAIIGANGKSGANLVNEAIKKDMTSQRSLETKSIKTKA
ncbi:hypothetical protein [Campylobacter concisus]|nr:hypothetical protein [Campylobacter concisus]